LRSGPAALPSLFRHVKTVLELRNVSKHYPAHKAVNGISLALDQGEFFSLLGPSGCGKTTTLRLIAGLETPTSGDILLNGEPVAQYPPYKRNVSTVFQNYALFPHLTVSRNVAFGLERRRKGTATEIATQVERMLALVQLSGKHDRMPSQISGGERQRVALARSLVLEPDVLLLDEPLSALDPKLRKQMRAELKSLQRRVGITFLFITHDQEEAMTLSDRMAVMNAGRIEQTGTPRELYREPQSRFVAEFLGEVNWLHGAGVRPENVQLSRRPPSHLSLPAKRCVVTGVCYLGNYSRVEARLDSGEIFIAQIPADSELYNPDDAAYVWWQKSDELSLAAGFPAAVSA
jgi:spermidine/putrescine transport system ATP-binding protein